MDLDPGLELPDVIAVVGQLEMILRRAICHVKRVIHEATPIEDVPDPDKRSIQLDRAV